MKPYKYEMKPLFRERLQALMPEPSDFQKFEETVHTAPLDFIRCNTLKITPNKLLTRLSKKWKVTQPFQQYPEIMLIEGKQTRSQLAGEASTDNKDQEGGANLQKDLQPGELGNSVEHLMGLYYVQEISSMLPPIALDPQPNEFVLDLFASPGSKTTQLAAKMQNSGSLLANDLKLSRTNILSANLERCGVTNTLVSRNDAISLCSKLSQSTRIPKFDKILVDAPCSGEGTLRSSPKTFQMWNLKIIKKLSRQQKKFLAFALRCLKQGGTLVYSTCTHTPEENEEIVSFALQNFPLKIETLNLPLKCRPGITSWNSSGLANNLASEASSTKTEKFNPEVSKSCRVYPQDNDSEGFFLAKFTLLEEIKK